MTTLAMLRCTVTHYWTHHLPLAFTQLLALLLMAVAMLMNAALESVL